MTYNNTNSNLRNIVREISNIRKHLHQYPELSYKEFETTSYIKNILQSWGLILNKFSALKTGGICEIGKEPFLSFRSDIDALPIKESVGHKYRSKNEGVMHACGHDYHIAIGLGLLRYFSLNPNDLNGGLKVIFQPAEEVPKSGGKKVAKEKIWENVESILAVHVDHESPVGKISLFKGTAQSSSTSIYIEMLGPGGHTSKPQESVDLVNVAGELVTQVPNFLRQHIDPRETLSLSFGTIRGGKTHNIIPSKIILKGTLRAFDERVHHKAIDVIKDFIENFSRVYNIKTKIKFPTFCPPVINDEALSNMFIKYMKETGKDANLIILKYPSLGTDDFAFYIDKVPGLYLQVGAKGSGIIHSGDLELDENLIEPSLKYITGFIKYYFAQKDRVIK